MNPCELYRDRLAAFTPEGEEDPGLARHLEACPVCRAEFQTYLGLTEELKNLAPADPGELFFQAQLRSIQRQVQEPVAAQTGTRRWWVPSLALAAAVVLLFIGFSRYRGTDPIPEPDWKGALLFLSEQEGLDIDPGLGLEDLNPEQLDRLAKNIEEKILQAGEEFQDENGDWDELSGPELDRLLQRMNDSSSGRRHEA